ncbi:MAG: GNAT family N-acetyltransferase [Deltaproteobacteria bacterium]|jgi:GNAT superfamily N-acetyltransferase|nr:GNAT family N-acetyltransferase [Deltaproteobacteria bacterium]
MENRKIEFVWGRHDAMWLHLEIFNEQKKMNLPTDMIDSGSTHTVFITDPSLNPESQRVGGSSIFLGYDYLLIDVFWVHPSLRRKSLGKKLMNEIEAFAKTRSKRRILLSTFEFQNALPFWLSCGFQEVGKIDDYPEGQKLIYLHKRLSA